MVETGVFPVEPREVQEAEPLIEQTQGLLNHSECMTLAIIAKDSSPNFPSVVGSEDPATEPQFRNIKTITPGNPKADEQVNEFAKAMKLINAATYSLSDSLLSLDLIEPHRFSHSGSPETSAKSRFRKVTRTAFGG